MREGKKERDRERERERERERKERGGGGKCVKMEAARCNEETIKNII